MSCTRRSESGRTTCVAVVQHYIDRVRAFNGVASMLVTEDGAACPKRSARYARWRRFGSRPQSVKAAEVLPDLDKYKGPPLEYGRMEPTASDPTVQQQFGMIVGIPNAGQVNALATLNIRGERSVTCRGDFDRHPTKVRCRPARPPVCEYFRKLPDALERRPSSTRPTDEILISSMMPMYGVVFSFKDPFDTKDMRSTGGGDARYDIDFPARDHVLVEQLRKKGAIIFAKAVNTEYNGRAGDPGGRHQPDKVLPSTLGYQRSTWAGNPSNPYDTTRSASLGSSSGSAVSVSINLVMASLGEETRASCRGPSNHNAVALILPHKSMLGFDGGAIGADIYCDRSGIHCRTIGDCAKVLDALKDPVEGYYDPRDPYTTVPRSSVLSAPYASHATTPGVPGALAGMRLGIIRESMVFPPGSKTEGPIVTAAAKEIKAILGERLGATLVESSDPLWKPDPEIEPMRTDFRRALAQAGAGFHARIAVQAGSGRTAGLQGVRGSDRADRVHARKGLRHRNDAADRLFRRDGGGADRTAHEPRHRHHPAAGAGDDVQIPYPAIPVPAEPRTGRRWASPKPWSIFPCSTRAQNSGATISARPSRIGRRWPTRAIRTASARASTSASCCANCCAGST